MRQNRENSARDSGIGGRRFRAADRRIRSRGLDDENPGLQTSNPRKIDQIGIRKCRQEWIKSKDKFFMDQKKNQLTETMDRSKSFWELFLDFLSFSSKFCGKEVGMNP